MKQLHLILVLIVVLAGCSQKKLSDRDRELQERQQAIDVKKAELDPIAGVYEGRMTGDNEYLQDINLTLEVRNVPENDKKADPVLIPKLLGTLRFFFGSPQTGEHLDAPVASSEFVKQKGLLTIVVKNAQFNEMVIAVQADGITLNGSWSAPSLGVSGKIEARR